MSPCGICGSLSLRERAGVRGPVSSLAIAAMERFMESYLFKNDLLTALEPRIPGGGTPPLYGRRDARRYGKQVHGEGRFPTAHAVG